MVDRPSIPIGSALEYCKEYGTVHQVPGEEGKQLVNQYLKDVKLLQVCFFFQCVFYSRG